MTVIDAEWGEHKSQSLSLVSWGWRRWVRQALVSLIEVSSGLVGLLSACLLSFSYPIFDWLHDLCIRLNRAVGLNGWWNGYHQERRKPLPKSCFISSLSDTRWKSIIQNSMYQGKVVFPLILLIIAKGLQNIKSQLVIDLYMMIGLHMKCTRELQTGSKVCK